MRVTVFCRGMGHSMHLARELHALGALERAVSGYPRFKLRKYTVPEHKVVSLRTAVVNECVRRAPVVGHRLFPRADYWNRIIFDRLARRYLCGTGVAVVWMHGSPLLLRWAKSEGVSTILECGAVHSGYLRETLCREYERLGLRFREDGSAIFLPASLQAELQQYAEADLLQVPSEFVRRSFILSGIRPEKLVKASYGTDCQTFRPGEKSDSVFRALYVGHLSVLKGLPVLLEAWKHLGGPGGAELTLVGRASEELEPLLRVQVPGLRRLGRVDHWQLASVYRQASVFVFPTWGDGWPLVVGEAMACGLPVICTPNSGASELVRDGLEGFITPAGDAEAIAERLSLLRRDDELRREMGLASRRRAEHFSWERYGRQVMHNCSRRIETAREVPVGNEICH